MLTSDNVNHITRITRMANMKLTAVPQSCAKGQGVSKLHPAIMACSMSTVWMRSIFSNNTNEVAASQGLYLSEVTSSTTMDGSVTAWGGSCRVPCPAEEGCEGALAAPKEAPALLWRCPV